jgi:hypothetical protein
MGSRETRLSFAVTFGTVIASSYSISAADMENQVPKDTIMNMETLVAFFVNVLVRENVFCKVPNGASWAERGSTVIIWSFLLSSMRLSPERKRGILENESDPFGCFRESGCPPRKERSSRIPSILKETSQ